MPSIKTKVLNERNLGHGYWFNTFIITKVLNKQNLGHGYWFNPLSSVNSLINLESTYHSVNELLSIGTCSGSLLRSLLQILIFITKLSSQSINNWCICPWSTIIFLKNIYNLYPRLSPKPRGYNYERARFEFPLLYFMFDLIWFFNSTNSFTLVFFFRFISQNQDPIDIHVTLISIKHYK